LPLTVYVPSTVYNTRFNTVYEVSRLRIVSNYVTQLDIEYYDPDTNSIYTRISVPTRILKGVTTEFLGSSRTPAVAGQAQTAQPVTTKQPRATWIPV
jgi:hypothetical protein